MPINLQSNFIEITFGHGCSPVNLLHIFRTPFPKKTSGGMLLLLVDGIIIILYLTFVKIQLKNETNCEKATVYNWV